MLTALPSRIMNYRVSAASPTEELMTLGQILSEVGDYMSTILDREHLSLSRRCATRLGKVVSELITRKCIKSQDDLYEISESAVAKADLSAMTVSELHTLYRQWPMRHRERWSEGREHLTYYYEGQIVRELQRRKPADKGERLKIDYCVATYDNELNNMSFIFSLPVNADDANVYPDPSRVYSPEELATLIRRYSDYRDIIGREILVEYTDLALDFISANPSRPMACLVDALAALREKELIRIPVLPGRLSAVKPW